MAGGILSPLDGVGLTVGAPPPVPAPAVGFAGLLDFAGVPVGVPAPAPAFVQPGFFGFVDFAGVPVGKAVAPAHGTFQGGGKRKKEMVRALLAAEMARYLEETSARRKKDAVAHRTLEVRTKQELEIGRRQKLLTTNAVFTTLLAEV